MSLSLSLVLTLTTLAPAHAWGTLGHATIAYIAQSYLHPATASWAQTLLNDTSTSYLANVASWADSYRATTAGAWSAPLHFIDAEDNPPTSCTVDYDRDCGASGCVVSAIANYTQRIGDSRLSDADAAEALRFLVHFIGDVTQPLHDEALALGGNQIAVTFDGYSDNLHSDWDTYIPQKHVGGKTLADAQKWASALAGEINDGGSYAGERDAWIAQSNITEAITSATAWAADGNALVCSVVMPGGVAALQTGDLYPTYYDSVVPTIEMQIAKGGYRLADWLNKLHAATTKSATVAVGTATKVLPDLTGRDLLPALRPMSRAKLAREAMGGDCCRHEKGHKH